MQRVTEQVDAAYLQQPPPRSLSPGMIANLLSDHIFERPLKAFLDPVIIAAVIALVVLFALRASTAIRLVPVLLIIIRLLISVGYLWRHVHDDLALLRNGLTVRAHVLGLRPHRTTMGTINGALLDCAIPVAPRRTYVGSIWLANGTEAQRLKHQGRVEVICLPRTPGTWRVIEDVKSDIRYDRMGSTQPLPQET
jgi:hypothetical protein